MSVKERILQKCWGIDLSEGLWPPPSVTSWRQLMLARDQLYYYFKSKKRKWFDGHSRCFSKLAKGLLKIFWSRQNDSDKFSDMIDWVCQFHRSQTVLWIAQLVQLWNCPQRWASLNMTQWTEKLPLTKTCMLTGQSGRSYPGPSSHLQYSRQHCHSPKSAKT